MTSLFGLDLADRTVLIAGGGPVAARRAQALADEGALLRVVAPYVCEDLAELLGLMPDRAEWLERDVREPDLEGVWLVLAATDSKVANAEVAAWAEQRRVFCVNAGAADEGSARTPATTRSGDLLVGVVTDISRTPDGAGADPRRVAAVRDQIGDLLRAGLDQRRQRPATGQVTLVGGGPGAVDLLTVRGRQALAAADVVVTDRLGPVDVLADLVGVEVINVGKTPGHHPVPQHEINAILVEQAQRGRQVVRLKGGDPFVFGRGGEEVIACREAGVAVQVVPGISSALSVPALAGIPLTHRGTSTSFHVTTGHAGLDRAAAVAVAEGATLVVLMGVSKLAAIATQAQQAGAGADTPVAVVERGSTPTERVTRSTLDRVAEEAGRVGVQAPAIIVIGDVADEHRLVAT
ncbi:uroporphyrinogen-III C-methyltransferase [Ruania suaedae]|uniref:uroporphyrinogen-III C-methyltransferase n=1 Tax=Ruania suaedae TaxID=2897774 RepID=UPI001E50D9BE|nr:uroporphyrinogen-III C-methyltransferase [Ruania suaedae]UFU04094.1 uroporphyrinogen-III C-methyltransferase [Ruania suaedae]